MKHYLDRKTGMYVTAIHRFTGEWYVEELDATFSADDFYDRFEPQ